MIPDTRVYFFCSLQSFSADISDSVMGGRVNLINAGVMSQSAQSNIINFSVISFEGKLSSKT